MKLFITGTYHFKNKIFLDYFIKNSSIVELVDNIDAADIVLSANKYFDTTKYKDKKFIFGPHFSIFPDSNTLRLSNEYNNSIYIQPSSRSVNIWKKDFNFNNLNIKSINFGVDTELFNESVNSKKDNVLVYFKNRSNDELAFIENFLKDKNINYKIFSYANKYKQEDYKEYLQTCKYGIWIGRHESQGFALQEALSSNIPLLVWNVKYMSQEIHSPIQYKGIYGNSIPYWDDLCGEFFFEKYEFENKFKNFVNNLHNYNPRKYILQNLSNEVSLKKWEYFLSNIDDEINKEYTFESYDWCDNRNVSCLSIDKIYCSHYLNNEKLLEFIKDKEYALKGKHHCFHIKESIHYEALSRNDYSFYDIYIKSTEQKEHSIDKFKELVGNFDISKMDKICLVYNNKLNKYVIIDGVHRLSYMVFSKLINDKIPLKYLDIKYPEETIDCIKEYLIKTTEKAYSNNWGNKRRGLDYGYHSFNIYNVNILGQRNPKERIDIFKKYIDFNNKTVIDFGCNSGGMLLHLPEIKKGYGFDYSLECIKSAEFIRDTLMYSNTVFIHQDLNKFIYDEHIKEDIDIIFLLSLGSWVQKWKELYTIAYNKSSMIILETNNDNEGKSQLLLFKELGARIILISKSSNDDVTGNSGRKTYLIIRS